MPDGRSGTGVGGRGARCPALGLEQSVLASAGSALGRNPCLSPRRWAVSGRIPPPSGYVASTRNFPIDDHQSKSTGAAVTRFGIRCGPRCRKPRMLGPNIRSYRIDRHALLGRPRHENDLRGVDIASPPGAAAPSAGIGGRRGEPGRRRMSGLLQAEGANSQESLECEYPGRARTSSLFAVANYASSPLVS
jgi:hypothetical protein